MAAMGFQTISPILRKFIYKQLGYKIGKGSIIYHQCFCGVGNGSKGRLTLGDYSYVNYHCFLDLGDDIIIGNHVSVAFGCTFINSSHKMGDEKQRAGKSYAAKKMEVKLSKIYSGEIV